jgi:hypothetical protein
VIFSTAQRYLDLKSLNKDNISKSGFIFRLFRKIYEFHFLVDLKLAYLIILNKHKIKIRYGGFMF